MDIRRLPPALARREFTLSDKQAHLILLEAGRLHLAHAHRDFDGAQAIWIPSSCAEVLRLEAGSRALILSLTRLELASIDGLGIAGSLLPPLSDQNLYSPLPSIRWQRMSLLCDLISEELSQPREDSHHRIEAASSLILTSFLRLVKPEARQGVAQLPLAERFMYLVSQHAHEHWGVSDYALALDVTRFQLGDAVFRHLGRKPQTYIQEQWLNQAMVLLRQPQIRIAAIAYRLGFQDPSYFSRAFKAATSETPKQWRETRGQKNSDNFSAWP